MGTFETIECLKGETLSLVEQCEDQEIVFTCASGRRFHMYHEQDCCESVTIDRIDGELNLLIGSSLVVAKEEPGHESSEGWYDSVTFTDFVLATKTHEVTIHWVGSSNGYYSESVYFAEIK